METTAQDVKQILEERYEEALKTLMQASRVARSALQSSTLLADKVRFSSLETMIDKTVHNLRLNIYEYQDAVKVACNNLEEPTSLLA
jgi:hypothetical protein